jgi:hypothetical protein
MNESQTLRMLGWSLGIVLLLAFVLDAFALAAKQ